METRGSSMLHSLWWSQKWPKLPEFLVRIIAIDCIAHCSASKLTFLTIRRPSWGCLFKIRTSKSHSSAPGASFGPASVGCRALPLTVIASRGLPAVHRLLSWATAGPASSQQDQKCLIYAVPLYFTENMWVASWDFFIFLCYCRAVVITACSPVLQLVFKRGRFHSSSAWTCWQGWAWELSRDQEVQSPFSIWNLFSPW